ncbi:PLP-dependent aminotransferase family protein [Rhodococcus sp. NPDC003318]|uniref:MocR-like pyridoxine biosynthesis transcription factor PdxR n=1 Tax=Rhodococcus sp. NPDC003318 TaxID=3364503 RepID=UPI0036C05F5C
MARTAAVSTVHLQLTDSDEPLRHRIAGAVIAALRSGALGPGDVLPSSRALAAALAVSRTAVVDAYDELSAAGFVEARPGSGTRVAPGAATAARAGVTAHVTATANAPAPAPRPDPGSRELDLTPGLPDTGLISSRDWRSAWRTAAAGPVPHAVPGPSAHPRLREVLSTHLRRTRGVIVSADEIVVVPGVASALRILVAAAGLAGRWVAFEDPGYTKARLALAAAGARIRPIGVDADGLDPTAVRPDDAAVYCTPAHQYPMGARMPATRRATLVAAAADAGRWVIEDDYDGEFRYGVAPLPALRTVEGGRESVAYVGTASKILTPALRLAWLIPPAPLLTAVNETLASGGESVCAITADAVAGFVESGSLTRHLARSNRTYSARRRAFVDALRTHLPDVEPLGVEAGLHVALRLPDASDDLAIADEAERRGVTVRALAAYRADPDGPRGLLCGYARLPESKADATARLLADVIGAAAGGAAGTSGSCTTSGS